MRKLFRFAVLVALSIWAWRYLVGRQGPHERAGIAYGDGSSIVLEPGSPGFARLADAARAAIGS